MIASRVGSGVSDELRNDDVDDDEQEGEGEVRRSEVRWKGRVRERERTLWLGGRGIR